MIQEFLSLCFELERLLSLLRNGFLARSRAKALMVPVCQRAIDLFERKATANDAELLCCAHPIARRIILSL